MDSDYLQPFISENVKKYWDELNNEKLVAPKCKNCGDFFFPPRAHCPKCLSREFEWIELSGEGTLYSWTLVAHGVGSEYVLGIIELKEKIGKSITRVLANLEDLKINMKMIATYTKIRGQKLLNWLPIL
ncbi:MAG: Zn-ribbon domain-containing OB-fold protein [Candidatus Helarchaeota archaeon]